MSESLALETQLLLQEVTQAKQLQATLVDTDETPVSELEAAKRALLDKLRQKKEQNKQRHQQVYAQRYGISLDDKKQEDTPAPAPVKLAGAASRLTPVKAKRMVKLPVAAAAPVASRQKKELLANLRTQAIKQGAQDMAKFFGYKSYEDQIEKLNEKEKKKMLESERLERMAQAAKAKDANAVAVDGEDEDSSSDFAPENSGENDGDIEVENEGESADPVDTSADVAPAEISVAAGNTEGVEAMQGEPSQPGDYEETQDLEALEAASIRAATSIESSSPKPNSMSSSAESGSSEATRRRRNRVTMDEDDDGNEADSEEDGKGDEEEAAERHQDEAQEKTKKDKAAAYRQMLQAEAMQNRKMKRLRKGANFVESEAEEDEEEDVLKIGGLGDFGFGVPQAATKESKEAEEERNALKLREDDLEGIVDDLSDDERDQEQDLEEIHRRELEEQDRQQVKEVMRNVKEGFGRNRRAFSGLAGAGARGRFNLDELVAADGDKYEAARLGLLESDEEMNGDDEHEEKEQKEDEEEEDEEAEMERMLRERFLNQPKIYITSSESEDEGEEEVKDDDDEGVKEEIESDEERERQQMKQFSERARINRRMQRMKDLQRQIAEETEQDNTAKAPLPNILLEEDEESESLLKVLNRKDAKKPATEADARSKEAALPRSTVAAARPRVGRFSSFGMGSAVRSTSSFSRVVDNCKLFNAGSTTGTAKGFVFTSFSSKTANADENAAPETEDAEMTEAAAQSASAKQTSKSRSAVKRPFAAVNGARAPTPGAAKKRKSDFFSVLASYQPDQH